jgi:hypothetical protein
MVAQFVTDLRQAFSVGRLEGYRPKPNGSDLDMLTNYFWNIDLAEALVPCLQAAELALRNALHYTLASYFNNPMWFYEPGFLESGQFSEFARALGKVSKKPQPLAGRIVAELTFGFWTAILSSPYDDFWKPNGYALLYTAMPNAVGVSRKQICGHFVAIKDLRKRIAHYEAVWYRPNLAEEHGDIHRAIHWINPTLAQAIMAVDNFQTVFTSRAQVQANLTAYLGIT